MLAAMFVFFVVGLGLIIGAKLETPAAEPTDEAAAVATEAEATETAVDALVGDETATEAEAVEPAEAPAIEEAAPAEPATESAPEAEPAA